MAPEAPQVSKVEVLLIEDDPLWCENKKKSSNNQTESSNNKTVSGPRGPTSQQGRGVIDTRSSFVARTQQEELQQQDGELLEAAVGLANVSEEALEALEFAPSLFIYPTEKHPPWSVLHEARCPRRSRARVLGGGARKDHWMASQCFSPLKGGILRVP